MNVFKSKVIICIEFEYTKCIFQFFTPIPITRFIWDSLPLRQILTKNEGIEYPKVIDYACGAGHFLTEGFEAVEVCADSINSSTKTSTQWVEKKIFGIEKDYRLARVLKFLFLCMVQEMEI